MGLSFFFTLYEALGPSMLLHVVLLPSFHEGVMLRWIYVPRLLYPSLRSARLIHCILQGLFLPLCLQEALLRGVPTSQARFPLGVMNILELDRAGGCIAR